MLHTDHCSKKLLQWLDGMMDEDEKYFAIHKEPLFSSHMIDLSEEDKEMNIATTKNYLERAAPMKQWLEMVSNIYRYYHHLLIAQRKLASPVARKMALIIVVSTTILFTLSLKIFGMFTKRSPLCLHTFL